uniref:Uncharacterized protein n=1 Tax=Hemipteran rhabdo-related virus OKIAV26 TaxID=2746290 RepID=A0A7D7IKA5_9RHAB|nr:hypothetical protein [Hemipteran rhabdo-related virus OKIAV26]
MATSARHLDILPKEIPAHVASLIDPNGIVRVPTLQKYVISVKAPLKLKDFWKLYKSLIHLIVLECFWGLGLSDTHYIQTVFGIYNWVKNCPDVQNLNENGSNATYSCITVYLYTLLPTFPYIILPQNSRSSYTVNLQKKGVPRGQTHFNFEWKMRILHHKVPTDLQYSKDYVLLENVQAKPIKMTEEFIQMFGDYNKYNIRRILNNMEITANIKLSTTEDSKKLSDWFSPPSFVGKQSEAARKLANKEKKQVFYKGKRK